MIDWWQPLLYIGAGGVVSLVTAIVTNRLTTSANRESEGRQAKRRLEEEQRQVIRQMRRERMQPVVSFLDLSKRYLARETIGAAFDAAYEKLEPGEKGEIPLETWQKAKHEALDGVPDEFQMVKAFVIAVASAASMPNLQDQLGVVMQEKSSSGGTGGTFGEAFKSADEMIEQYLAGAEPHSAVTADDRPAQTHKH